MNRRPGLYLALVLLLPALACVVRAEPPEIWFPDVNKPLKMEQQTGERLAVYAADRLLGTESEPAAFPEELAEDSLPRIVFISLSDGESRARTARGEGKGLRAALEVCIRRADQLGVDKPRWLKLDVVQVGTAEARASAVLPLGLPPRLAGLAFDRSTGVAFLPAELLAYTMVGPGERLLFPRIVQELERAEWRQGRPELVTDPQHLNLYRFVAVSFFTDGTDVHRLYRGHRVFESIDREQVMASARAGGEYLLRAIDDKGRFVYEYDPGLHRATPTYNILRHAGTVYSMLELYEVTEDERLLESAERGLDFLDAHIQPAPRPGDGACVVERGEAKLGGAALAVVAMARHSKLTGARDRLPTMRKLATWMMARQQPGGGFARHKVTYPEGTDTGFVSEYYPGEAILALMRLHALTGDEEYLDAADRAARYIIEVRDQGLPTVLLPHDHWLLYGLAELYPRRTRQVFMDHVLLLGGVILANQNLDPPEPDWHGGFSEPPRTAPAATRAEGLMAAYRMLKKAGRDEPAARCLEGAARAAIFQILTQIRPPVAMYMHRPQICLGAFRESLSDPTIRIDFVQHNISALLALHRAMGQE